MSYGRTWLLAMPVLLILTMPSVTFCQSGDMQDVVYLKNGSIIRGIIVEQIPQESIKIQTADGSIFVYAMDEITRIVKEKRISTSPVQPLRSRKEPGVACLISVFLPGGGQFYNGEITKGAIMLGAATAGSLMIFSTIDGINGDTESDGTAQAGAFIFLGAWLWSLIDAPISASKINRENGWTLAPFPDKDITVSVAGLSKDGKTAPGIVFSWKF